MNKDFLNWELTNALHSLGYNGDTLMWIDDENDIINDSSAELIGGVRAILYSQAFRWFREKYGLNPRKHIFIVNQMGFKTYKPHMDNKPLNEDDFWNGYDTYEEAQDACLRKLIEIVKEKNE